MNTSNNGHDRAGSRLDNISASRYISHMPSNGAAGVPDISARFVGERGILFRADCLDLLANIRDSSIDLVFADPPFNLGKDYQIADFSDNLANEMYMGWCRTWLLQAVRVLKPGGSLFLYHLPKSLMRLGAWLDSAVPDVAYKSWIALNMKGSFPIKGRIHPAHYGLLHYVKTGGPETFNVVRVRSATCRNCKALVKDYGGYRGKYKKYEDENGVPWVQVSDFWEDTRPARGEKSRANRINELPLQIPERAILMATNEGDVVLDFFAGGGSVLHAADLHGRYWIGADKGEPEAALRRIATFVGGDEVDRPRGWFAKCVPPRVMQSIA